ncbi:hypothetical protein TNCV_1741531 [Trichonephila clavipes]|uniref:Uncharacterized protein n=1 Tax=Trichonephila clavipes TaxID=2585209 RepID=A0A8X6UY79_TRICX|nr:hypothetical protein TNCV_1741531 [Trichonephila clavipes]
MVDRSVHQRITFQPKHRFSLYFHMERTRNPLPTLLCPPNRQLRWRRYNGLGRHLTGSSTHLLVFERVSVTGYSPYELSSQLSKPQLYRACVGGSEEAIETRNPPPKRIHEIKTALLNEWEQLPQELINCHNSSMRSRCEACIDVVGIELSFSKNDAADSKDSVVRVSSRCSRVQPTSLPEKKVALIDLSLSGLVDARAPLPRNCVCHVVPSQSRKFFLFLSPLKSSPPEISRLYT